MSDRPISAGDLVQIVRPAPCCGNEYGMGLIFRVVSLDGNGHCMKCGAYPLLGAWGSRHGVIFSRLKRIPPLDELEGEKRDEEITT